jgi:hypothetical protein
VRVLNIGLDGWRIHLATSAITGATTLRTVLAEQFHLRGAGRYGRFWWLHLRDKGDRLLVVLGSHLWLQALDGDPWSGATPPGQRALLEFAAPRFAEFPRVSG